MISLYARIAGNYFKPLGFKITYAVLALWVVFAMRHRASWRDPWASVRTPTPFLIFFVFLPTVWVAGLGILYLKEQLVTWQPSLVPNYRRPHLIVGGAFLMLALCSVPLLFRPILYLDVLGAIAVCAAGTSIVGWLLFDPSIKTILILFAALAVLCLPRVQHVIGQISQGESRRDAAAVLVGSLALLAWVWWRLACLREGMPQYRTVALVANRRAMTEIRTLHSAALDTIVGWIARYPSWRITARRQEPAGSSFSRASHRRIVTAGGWVPWRLGALWSLGLLLMLVCISFACDANNRATFQASIAPIVFIISMPAAPIITSSLWMRRGSMLPYEMTLPASRRSFVRETMIALARDYFSCWAGAFVMSFTLMILTQQIGKTSTLEFIPGFLFFFSGQVAALAVIAWTLRFRSSLLSIFTMIVAAAMTLPVLVVTVHGRVNDAVMAGTILIYTVGGFVVLFDAYRRWLRVNFE